MGHLLSIAQNSERNKMTLRNISIVFSPTLEIPFGIFNILVSEFSNVFVDRKVDSGATRNNDGTNPPSEPNSVSESTLKRHLFEQKANNSKMSASQEIPVEKYPYDFN